MSRVKVRFFANVREIVGQPELLLEASTIRDVLNTLTSQKPALHDVVCEDGEVRSYITILVNGTNIRDVGGLATTLSDGDEIAIFPPVSGG
jgi:molybdopterin synthase sulfur carrier subunit